MSLDQSKIIETIVQHDEIHLEDYLIEKRSQFKPLTGSNMNLDNSKFETPLHSMMKFI